MRKASRWVFGGLTLAVVLPVVALLVAIWAGGWRVHAVQTASMEPQLPRGAAVLLDDRRPEEIGTGSVIAFTDPNDADRTVVHRVRRVVEGPSGRAFETQGDGNAVPDPDLVPMRLVRGRVVHHVVGLGSAVGWLSKSSNARLLLLVPLAALGLNEGLAVRDRRRSRRATSEVDRLQARIAELEALVGSRPGPQPHFTTPGGA